MVFQRTKRPDYSYNHIQNPQDAKEVKRIFDRAYTKALKYLAIRNRSEKEIRGYLIKNEFHEKIVEKVIDRLLSQNFLNDQDFAEWWIRGRQASRARSQNIIRKELRAKGVADTIIDKALAAEGKDDFTTAKKYFEKRKSRFDKYSGKEYFQKAAAFLQRRGFSWDVVKKVLKEGND